MTKVQARGIKVDADGLGITLRVNGIIFSPVPVVTLDVNDGFKTITSTPDWENHHPSGGYTDLHYVLSEKIFPVDVVLATGITNPPFFVDKAVAKAPSTFVSNDSGYDYELTVGTGGVDEAGYSAGMYGSIKPLQEHFPKVVDVIVNTIDGGTVVGFGDIGDDKVAEAITVKFEGLIIPDQDGVDGEFYSIRLEWSDTNERYELASNASLVALATYLTNVEGATIGFGITYHN